MPPAIKPGSLVRYWREVEGLSRLEIAIVRDEHLAEDERNSALGAILAAKEAVIGLAKKVRCIE